MKVDMLKKHVYFFRGTFLTGGENMGRHKGGKNRKGSFLTEAGKKSPILCRWWDELHSTARKEEKRKRS
jgi:hypothetical protein